MVGGMRFERKLRMVSTWTDARTMAKREKVFVHFLRRVQPTGGCEWLERGNGVGGRRKKRHWWDGFIWYVTREIIGGLVDWLHWPSILIDLENVENMRKWSNNDNIYKWSNDNDTLGSINTLGSCMHPSKKHINRSPLRTTIPLDNSTGSSPARVSPTKGAGPFKRKVSWKQPWNNRKK